MKVTFEKPVQLKPRLRSGDIGPGQVGLTPAGALILGVHGGMRIWLTDYNGRPCTPCLNQYEDDSVAEILPPGTKIILEIQ